MVFTIIIIYYVQQSRIFLAGSAHLLQESACIEQEVTLAAILHPAAIKRNRSSSDSR